MTIEHAYGLLGLVPGASENLIRRAFRERARSAHPDVGGSTEDWLELSRACEVALDHAAASNVMVLVQPIEPVRLNRIRPSYQEWNQSPPIQAEGLGLLSNAQLTDQILARARRKQRIRDHVILDLKIVAGLLVGITILGSILIILGSIYADLSG